MHSPCYSGLLMCEDNINDMDCMGCLAVKSWLNDVKIRAFNLRCTEYFVFSYSYIKWV